MWPLILGGLGVAAFIAVAMSNNKTGPTKSKSTGEKWHFGYSVYPPIDSEAEFNVVDKQLQTLFAVWKAKANIEYPAPNTLDVDITFNTKLESLPEIGSSVQVGKYTITLVEADKVS